MFHAIGGVAVIARGGDFWKQLESQGFRVDGRTDPGLVIGAGVDLAVGRGLSLRVTVEDYVHRTKFVVDDGSGAQESESRQQNDLVISAGDLIAGQKASLTAPQVQAMWAAFDQSVRGPLAQAGIPFAFTLGNHDASLPGDRREAQRLTEDRTAPFTERPVDLDHGPTLASPPWRRPAPACSSTDA